jgi:hypothetical protein
MSFVGDEKFLRRFQKRGVYSSQNCQQLKIQLKTSLEINFGLPIFGGTIYNLRGCPVRKVAVLPDDGSN